MTAGRLRRYCTFYLGDEPFALDLLVVREIDRGVAITPVPGAPAAVRGLANLRGQIATVIDPAVRLGQPPRALGPATPLVVLRTRAELEARGAADPGIGDARIGLCVDRVADVLEIADDAIEAIALDPAAAADPVISGIARHGEATLRILEPHRLLARGDAP